MITDRKFLGNQIISSGDIKMPLPIYNGTSGVLSVLILVWHQKIDPAHTKLGKISISIKDVHYNIEPTLKTLFKDHNSGT